MYKKFGDVNKKKDNEWDAEQVADNIGEIISPIPAFGSFLGARGAPTSVIYLILFNLILNMSRYLPDPNKQTNKHIF